MEKNNQENDQFFAAPFVEQQNQEQNEPQNLESPLNDGFERNQYGNEEFASEVMADDPYETAVQPETKVTQNAAMGWLALTIAIASLFMWPAILGPSAAIIGFFALTRGHRALGIWSIVIGLISFMAYIVLVPLYA